jgi:hypothetical protein
VVGPSHFTNDALGCSMLAGIQRKIIGRGKRNAASRLFHAKDDKETIATWKSDLSRILHTFNVRSVVSVWQLLTVRSQTELAINTNVTVSGMRHDVTTTHSIVSEVQHDVVTTHTIVSHVLNDVASTHTMVSDIHHIMTKGQDGAEGNNHLVSTTCTTLITE